jgi:hypothetical protein
VKYANTSVHFTFLRYTNITLDIESAKNIVVHTYTDDPEELILKIKGLICLYPKKTIIIDNTTEKLSEFIGSKLLVECNSSNIIILCNGVNDYNLRSNLINSRIKFIEEQFFVKYYYYYTPNFSAPKDIPKRKFLLLTGKDKIERRTLVRKLMQRGLDQYGYISYFGIVPEVGSIPLHTNNSNPVYKEFVKLNEKENDSFFKQINKNLTLDEKVFHYNISHSRNYLAKYYNAVDFIIIPESDIFSTRVFHTEKTTKAIQLNKKFLLLNTQGSIEDLKVTVNRLHNIDISHLTDWVDTTYDSTLNIDKKINTIVDIVEKQVYGERSLI